MKTLEDSRFKKGQKKNWSVCDRKILSYFGTKNLTCFSLKKGRVNSFEGCWLFRRQYESESDQVGIKILKGNVNGESHSQQSQKGLFVRKIFLLDMVFTGGSKIIQAFNIFTHKNINVYGYKVQQWEDWLMQIAKAYLE